MSSECPNTRFALINTTNGKVSPLKCRTYACPDCGPIKVWVLKKNLTRVFSQWRYVRMWTFTLTNRKFVSIEDHYRFLQEAWRYFITYVRRSLALSADQRRFKFVKVPEQHKSGYFHYHVMIDRFIDREVFQKIWESIVQEKLKSMEHFAFVHVRLIPDARTAAFYVSKYVTKLLKESPFTMRRYSTSYLLRVFLPKKSNPDYCIFIIGRNFEDIFPETLPLPSLDLIEYNFTSKDLVSELFDDRLKLSKVYFSEYPEL